MAKNDQILIDGIIDERVQDRLPSNRRDEVFEYLAFEQILKDYDPSREEIDTGIVDGTHDGGIDGWYILVNGHFILDPESFVWPKTRADLEIFIVTCKHHDTFKQAPLDALIASLSELFDFSVDRTNLKGTYSDDLITRRENFHFAYRKLAPSLRNLSVNVCYASRGDTTLLGESVIARSEQIVFLVDQIFGSSASSFLFCGASQFLALYRRSPNYLLELPFSEVLAEGERYVLLTRLIDYYDFVTEKGKLRRYLFDSNVRDFMGLTGINEDIKSTLENSESPDFWWLNNGVTMLTTSASVVGNSIILEDVQIVNGLQSTESIYRYFKSGASDPKNRSVLVKIIVSSDSDIRDSIIRATNNQTNIETAALYATDKIQRDIEDILKRNGYMYERRKNHYVNRGFSSDEVISPIYLASGFVSLVLKDPIRAASLRSKFMRSKDAYNAVFSEKIPLGVWPTIAYVLRSSDGFLEKKRPRRGHGTSEGFLKKWRHIVGFIITARILNTYWFKEQDLLKVKPGDITEELLKETWKLISDHSASEAERPTRGTKRVLKSLFKRAGETWGIQGYDWYNKPQKRQRSHIQEPVQKRSKKVTMDFALQVNELLPEQPWKPGVEYKIMEKLGCTRTEYFQATKTLIEEGIRKFQKDGVVYDSEGNVVCFDSKRVNAKTMELKDSNI